MDEAKLNGRRPVLLFGDSFSACMVPADDCWQGQLERSELGRELCLLNYGVPGYGLDQAWLLLEATLDMHRHLDPIVVLGILVDDDLDRCAFGLRDYPKPRFLVDGDAMRLLPMSASTPADYIRAHGMGVRSYVARFFAMRTGFLGPKQRMSWTGVLQDIPSRKAVARGLLREIDERLEASGLSYFVVLFHTLRAMRSRAAFMWQEPLLRAEFTARGVSWVSAKEVLLAHSQQSGIDISKAYIAGGYGTGHYTPAAHVVAFEAFRTGIEECLER